MHLELTVIRQKICSLTFLFELTLDSPLRTRSLVALPGGVQPLLNLPHTVQPGEREVVSAQQCHFKIILPSPLYWNILPALPPLCIIYDALSILGFSSWLTVRLFIAVPAQSLSDFNVHLVDPSRALIS